MAPLHRSLLWVAWVRQGCSRLVFPRREFASIVEGPSPEGENAPDSTALDMPDVAETRSPPPKGLAALRINEGGNINRANLLGTVAELKLLDRLSKPEQQWATMFVRTRIPILANSYSSDAVDTEESNSVEYRLCTYYNRVHVFDRRLLPFVKRLRPGDRVFVTGFLSYYKPTLTSSPPEVAKVRKIGAVVAERLVLLGSSGEVFTTGDALDHPVE
ncbi:unnamed protein product [Mesocestoides corti]|uniref:Single-strand DNA-binding protein n=1 Tax=Mesocestoides corti TaxID=53468 RepID=A0A0R3ULH5_MESCO|nr:unnamed protein product [Mesocestoides corti]